MKEPSAPNLYPELPKEEVLEDRDHSYRLGEISALKKKLEVEREKRGELYKKYQRGVNVLDGVDTSLLTLSIGMGIAGMGFLSTVIAAPVALGLEITALVCGTVGVVGRFVGRRFAVKAKKHDEIRVLAESKLNTIADHVSKALIDGTVSDDEFRLIMSEVDKFAKMKSQIRSGARKAHSELVLDEETKQSLIQQGRDEVRDSLLKKLDSQ